MADDRLFGDDRLFDVAALHQLLLESDQVESFLEGLAAHALKVLPDLHSCSITLQPDRRPMTVASAGDAALALDEKQYGADDGPCLQALREEQEVYVADMLHEDRWGDYPAYATAMGIRASLAVPLTSNAYGPGALNLYSDRPDAFSEEQVQRARILAAQATGAIALALRIADTAQLAADLRAAMESRRTIDQAIGIIMAQQRCSAEHAFGLLRNASQQRNVKLRDLCHQLVTAIGGTPPASGTFSPRS